MTKASKSRRRKPKLWRKFEKDVAQLYIELGALEVQHDKDVAGNQIDVFARVPLVDGTYSRHIISCKCYNRAAGVADVREWLLVFQACRTANEADSAVVVSSKGFTRSAKTLAADSGVRLRSLDELKWSAVNLDPYVTEVTDEIGQEPVFATKRYIPLRLVREGQTKQRPAEDVIKSFLSQRSNKLLIILGDYGVGKTTFSKHVFVSLASGAWTDSDAAMHPVYLNLREYPAQLNLRSFILDELINKHDARCQNYSAFKRLFEGGRILLILDAFDEMASRVSYQQTVQNFEAIIDIMRGAAKAILTCRTHFFKNPNEVHDILEGTELYQMSREARHGIYYVQPFSDHEIESFVHAACPEQAEAALDCIQRTYDLMGLASRPILLEMITQVLPTLIASAEPINTASLYNTYVSQWLKRDDWRVKLDRANRRGFTVAFAMQMYLQQHTSFSWEEIRNAVRHDFPTASDQLLEDYENDIRICSFIRRNGEEFEFVHKSFVEYFVAICLYGDIVRDDSMRFSYMRYSQEVLSFLAQLMGTAELRSTLRRWLGTSKANETLASNTLLVLAAWEGRLSGSFNDLEIREHNFLGMQLADCRIDRGQVEGVVWNGGEWTSMNSSNGQWSRCEARHSSLVAVLFHRDVIEDFRITDSVLREFKWSECQLEDLRVTNVEFDVVNVSECKVKRSQFSWHTGGLSARSCVFDDSTLEGRIDLLVDCKFNHSTLVECDFSSAQSEGTVFSDTVLRRTKWSRCALSGVIFDGGSIQSVRWDNSEIENWSKPPKFYAVKIERKLRASLEEMGAKFFENRKGEKRRKGAGRSKQPKRDPALGATP